MAEDNRPDETPLSRIRDLPDLHPDAIGATVNGVYFTRDEYGALRQRSTSPGVGEVWWTFVAYMPVPRCDQCRFWTQDGPDFGLCRMSSLDETFTDLPPVERRLFSSRDLRAVITHKAFGCVQWRAKEALKP